MAQNHPSLEGFEVFAPKGRPTLVTGDMTKAIRTDGLHVFEIETEKDIEKVVRACYDAAKRAGLDAVQVLVNRDARKVAIKGQTPAESE